jgi:hypothetical protein
MEDSGALAAAASPAATSISAEIDTMFADAVSDSTNDSPSEESAAPETTPNPQDSTVQPKTAIDFEPGDDEAPAPTPAEPEKAAVAAKPAEPLEAVPVGDEDAPGEEYEQRGKKWIRYPEARGREVYAGYQTAKVLSKELGLDGPVTPEIVRTLANDKTILDHIDFDVMSPDPAEQARAFRYLFTTAKKAYDGNHAAHNPHETMADALLYAASQSAPEVIQGLEQRITQETLNRLYQKAVATGLETQAGQDLLASVQRTDQALTGTFRKRSELANAQKAVDPLAARTKELETREGKIQELESRQAKEDWDRWSDDTNLAVDSAIVGAITGALKPVAASLEKFPQTQQNVELRLREEIKSVFRTDQRFKAERDRYVKQASIAGTEQIRDGWRARIVQLYTSTAERVLREKAPPILSESAQALKAKSDKTHERLKGTQQLRGTPAGGHAPNGTTAPSTGNGKFDSKSWASEFEAAFN